VRVFFEREAFSRDLVASNRVSTGVVFTFLDREKCRKRLESLTVAGASYREVERAVIVVGFVC
jgi:hypothetical protein